MMMMIRQLKLLICVKQICPCFAGVQNADRGSRGRKFTLRTADIAHYQTPRNGKSPQPSFTGLRDEDRGGHNYGQLWSRARLLLKWGNVVREQVCGSGLKSRTWSVGRPGDPLASYTKGRWFVIQSAVSPLTTSERRVCVAPRGLYCAMGRAQETRPGHEGKKLITPVCLGRAALRREPFEARPSSRSSHNVTAQERSLERPAAMATAGRDYRAAVTYTSPALWALLVRPSVRPPATLSNHPSPAHETA
ncbi:hypothetical protein SKAU_G00353610 [Synaphobranchus kaupii]|uniref:Secreted protein n=1 Tax=Synaphobranchus kaupii TaxID=118154 RepID=A0A9Q1EL26_SYNKA|nr:hypothetical protein SKAU_G00353610 [Synaphobranchus kaupii]